MTEVVSPDAIEVCTRGKGHSVSNQSCSTNGCAHLTGHTRRLVSLWVHLSNTTWQTCGVNLCIEDTESNVATVTGCAPRHHTIITLALLAKPIILDSSIQTLHRTFQLQHHIRDAYFRIGFGSS